MSNLEWYLNERHQNYKQRDISKINLIINIISNLPEEYKVAVAELKINETPNRWMSMLSDAYSTAVTIEPRSALT